MCKLPSRVLDLLFGQPEVSDAQSSRLAFFGMLCPGEIPSTHTVSSASPASNCLAAVLDLVSLGQSLCTSGWPQLAILS